MEEIKHTSGFLNQAAHYIPFVGLMVNKTGETANRPMLTRIIEQSTVGIVAAGFALYVDNERQNDKLENMEVSMSAMNQNIANVTVRLEAKVEKLDDKLDSLTRDVYSHK